MLRRLSNQDRHKQLDLLKFKRMSSQKKTKKVLKKTFKTPLIVESDDESDMKPIHTIKSKAKPLDVARNPFIDHESVEEDPEQLESDYVASDVEVLDKSETNDESGREEEEVVAGGEEENESYENKGDDAEEEKEEEQEEQEQEQEAEDQEVEELLPCFLCKSDMKIVSKDGLQMLFCSAGSSVCTPPFTTPATYLALREMSKAVHPNYLHTKKGTPPRCYKHNIPMALSFCKSTSEKFADRPVFKCAVRAGKNPFTNREDSSFVKCTDALFGDIGNLAKARNEYKVYQAQIIVEKARNIRSKNLVVKSLKFQEEQDRLAGKKRNATSDRHSAPKSKISCKTTSKK